MTAGERIREARIQRGMTQKQLGERAGIAEPTIRKYELGKLNPKYETMQKIASALNVTVGYIQGYETMNTSVYCNSSASVMYISIPPLWEGKRRIPLPG